MGLRKVCLHGPPFGRSRFYFISSELKHHHIKPPTHIDLFLKRWTLFGISAALELIECGFVPGVTPAETNVDSEAAASFAAESGAEPPGFVVSTIAAAAAAAAALPQLRVHSRVQVFDTAAPAGSVPSLVIPKPWRFHDFAIHSCSITLAPSLLSTLPAPGLSCQSRN